MCHTAGHVDQRGHCPRRPGIPPVQPGGGGGCHGAVVMRWWARCGEQAAGTRAHPRLSLGFCTTTSGAPTPTSATCWCAPAEPRPCWGRIVRAFPMLLCPRPLLHSQALVRNTPTDTAAAQPALRLLRRQTTPSQGVLNRRPRAGPSIALKHPRLPHPHNARGARATDNAGSLPAHSSFPPSSRLCLGWLAGTKGRRGSVVLLIPWK